MPPLPSKNRVTEAGAPPPVQPRPEARYLVDWRAIVGQADRGCCCERKPVAVALIPPSPDRAHPTDLLLCHRHYRLCDLALAAAGAAVLHTGDGPLVPGTRILL
jgi:hypothetical protein